VPGSEDFSNVVEDLADYEYLSSSPDEKALVEAAARYCRICMVFCLQTIKYKQCICY